MRRRGRGRLIIRSMIEHIPTSLLAAAGLIGGYASATRTHSRPLGGAVMAGFGLPCIYIWARRDGGVTAAALTSLGFGAFGASHVLGPRIGAWRSVLAVSAAVAATNWAWSDRKSRA